MLLLFFFVFLLAWYTYRNCMIAGSRGIIGLMLLTSQNPVYITACLYGMEIKMCLCVFTAPWNTKYPSTVKPFHFNFCLFKMENNTVSEVQQERFAQDCLGNSLLNQITSCDSVLTRWFPSVLSLQFQEKQNLYSGAVDAVQALCVIL